MNATIIVSSSRPRKYIEKDKGEIKEKFSSDSDARWIKKYKVEQCFGTLKRRFQFRQTSYFSTAKCQAQTVLKSIAYNILKAINKVIKLQIC